MKTWSAARSRNRKCLRRANTRRRIFARYEKMRAAILASFSLRVYPIEHTMPVPLVTVLPEELDPRRTKG